MKKSIIVPVYVLFKFKSADEFYLLLKWFPIIFYAVVALLSVLCWDKLDNIEWPKYNSDRI